MQQHCKDFLMENLEIMLVVFISSDFFSFYFFSYICVCFLFLFLFRQWAI